MGNGFEYIRTQPLAEFHHPLLMTGGAKMPPLAGKCQQVFMAALMTADSGKAVMQITTV